MTRVEIDPARRAAERRRMVETQIANREVRDGVTPRDTVELEGMPDTYPFGL